MMVLCRSHAWENTNPAVVQVTPNLCFCPYKITRDTSTASESTKFHGSFDVAQCGELVDFSSWELLVANFTLIMITGSSQYIYMYAGHTSESRKSLATHALPY